MHEAKNTFIVEIQNQFDNKANYDSKSYKFNNR